MQAAVHRLSSSFKSKTENLKKNKKKLLGRFDGPPVKALAKEKGHAATAWGKVQEAAGGVRALRSLDLMLNVNHLSPQTDSFKSEGS